MLLQKVQLMSNRENQEPELWPNSSIMDKTDKTQMNRTQRIHLLLTNQMLYIPLAFPLFFSPFLHQWQPHECASFPTNQKPPLQSTWLSDRGGQAPGAGFIQLCADSRLKWCAHGDRNVHLRSFHQIQKAWWFGIIDLISTLLAIM